MDTTGYQCQCFAGYQGTHCETVIDNCASNPCVNGDCKSSTSGYTCTCHEGYKGDQCESVIDNCASNPCVNGDCKSSTSGYTCTCHEGYKGEQCESEKAVLSSCKEVRGMNPNAKDGEYWIYPTPFNGKKVKIYCFDMAKNAREYVTLKAINRGNYPNLKLMNCKGTERAGLRKVAGRYAFAKVRVNIKNMELVLNDFTFATTVGVKQRYGIAADCYTNHNNGRRASCGTKGYFIIDTSGTGMIINESTQWKTFGKRAFASVSKSDDYYKIRLECGGLCGGCQPTTPLVLKYKEHVEEKQWERLPPTCADHQKKGKTTDGEYLVYPPVLSGVKVRVYCHGMKTKTPKEYITLKHPNVGENPDKSDKDCTGHTTRSKFWRITGKIVYTKVRIHIMTMVAEEFDFTFAKLYGKLKLHKKPISFGHARDGYTKHYKRKKSKCGPIGTFVIDMRGTGLKVNDNLTWLPYGTTPYAEWSREHANATVHLRCGGYYGWCVPMDLLTFVPNPNDIY
ncbi:uncharacterized protein LOC121383641 [Gigantopelta aegis]|uniref:uncharacterized protein LOC121383641 n=1 Tax=Gigantopelta aegis TaxID=1735272 RepID=UPI001B8880F3|nr:uncharacterized protein LOC121383641 [Gigantopelta aegis]